MFRCKFAPTIFFAHDVFAVLAQVEFDVFQWWQITTENFSLLETVGKPFPASSSFQCLLGLTKHGWVGGGQCGWGCRSGTRWRTGLGPPAPADACAAARVAPLDAPAPAQQGARVGGLVLYKSASTFESIHFIVLSVLPLLPNVGVAGQEACTRVPYRADLPLASITSLWPSCEPKEAKQARTSASSTRGGGCLRA